MWQALAIIRYTGNAPTWRVEAFPELLRLGPPYNHRETNRPVYLVVTQPPQFMDNCVSPSGCKHPGVKVNDDYRKATMPYKYIECEQVFGDGEIEEVDGQLRKKVFRTSPTDAGAGEPRRTLAMTCFPNTYRITPP